MFDVPRSLPSLLLVALLVTCGTRLATDTNVLKIKTQRRVKADGSADQFRVVQESQRWDAAKTAIIVIDMWDAHHCIMAARRVDEMAPHVNRTVQPVADRVEKAKNDAIEIHAADAVTADGQEVFNLLQQHGIDNAIIMGVHTNRCVLGRPFGIRQMAYLKQNVVLCRDLTDSYRPASTRTFSRY